MGNTGPESPDGTGALAERGGRVLLDVYHRQPLEIVDGRGCRLRDAVGREYLDFAAGIAVNALGHRHPAVVAALREASSAPLHVSNLYWTEPGVRLAERLVDATGLERAFFCNSGAEACEGALKIARRARPGRIGIVAFEGSFHGRTTGALAVTGRPKYREPFEPLLPGVTFLPYGDRDRAAAAIDASVAAVLVEPVQGEGGVRPAPSGWLRFLRESCDAAGALLVVDEVQTGIGRTGTFLACQADHLRPDVLLLAKGLGGGVPIGAVLARGDAAVAICRGEHGSTFGGNLLAATVANAVLDVVLAGGFLDKLRSRGERLGAGLRNLASRHREAIADVRGRGLMWGVELQEPAARAIDRLRALGLLVSGAGENVLRLVPPLIVSDGEIDDALNLLDRALERK